MVSIFCLTQYLRRWRIWNFFGFLPGRAARESVDAPKIFAGRFHENPVAARGIRMRSKKGVARKRSKIQRLSRRLRRPVWRAQVLWRSAVIPAQLFP
jgi:hypothetical protein